MAELIEIPFGIWTWWAHGTMYKIRLQVTSCEGAIYRGHGMPTDVRQHSAVSCKKIAQLTEMPFRLWTREGPGIHAFDARADRPK